MEPTAEQMEEYLNILFNREKRPKRKSDYKIDEIQCIDKEKISEKEKEELKSLGEDVIKNEQYAVVTMAGGQGTRLGFDGPKGTYKLNIGENGKYIFEILLDNLKRAKEKYGIELNWYIMTSKENNEQTIKFFEENNYFEYNKDKIKFFTQGELPLIDFKGRGVLDEDGEMICASNGNGNVYEALVKSGMLQDMKDKGIKWVYACGVDNILANLTDDLFLGLAIKNGVQGAAKSVAKSSPEEKVGVFCKKNGRPGVIEYIDMTEEMINKKNQDGELAYGDAYIVSNLFTVEAIEEITKHKLRIHCAVKKGYYKMETFVFDGFEHLENMAILRVKREEEFAPIKNKEGLDSPETAMQFYKNYWKMIEQ